jgi:hypothetical protein
MANSSIIITFLFMVSIVYGYNDLSVYAGSLPERLT